jgi:hypothetical protein
MNTKDLIRLGVPVGEPIQLAYEFIQNFIAQVTMARSWRPRIQHRRRSATVLRRGELRAPLARVRHGDIRVLGSNGAVMERVP